MLEAAQAETGTTGLVLWKAYTAKETGEILGLSDKSVYGIPEAMLPRARVGATGRTVRYLGINILCYLAGLPPVDTEAIARKVRQAFIEQASRPPAVHSMRSAGSGERHRIY